MSPEVYDFEPSLALFPPGDGDSLYPRLFAQCSALSPGVGLAVEIGRGQLAAIHRHAQGSGLEIAAVREDYAGIPRTVLLRRRKN